jgi:hypothetical protein
VPLFTTKSTSGLFPGTATGKQAAQRCCDEGLLQEVTATAGGRTGTSSICTITDRGLDYLLGQVSPRQVLEDFVRVLETREAQVAQLVTAARSIQHSIESLRSKLLPVLDRVSHSGNGAINALFCNFHEATPSTELASKVLEVLGGWPGGSAEDCPLPELFRLVAPGAKGCTIGTFHDCLRQLQDAGRIYLHPWTGPLYDIPEPPCALLIGHEIAYYASLRGERAKETG